MRGVHIPQNVIDYADSFGPRSVEFINSVKMEVTSHRLTEFFMHNPQFAVEIDKMPSGQKQLAISRVAGWLEGQQHGSRNAAPAPRRANSAPEPIRPVGMSGHRGNNDIFDENLDYATFKQQSAAQEREHRRRGR
jgi:hypothetical protein